MTIRMDSRGGYTVTLDTPFMGETTWDLDGYLMNLRGAALRDAARDLGINVKSRSKVADIRHDMRNILISRADQSGVEILADLLSLDGGKTPARITPVIDSQATLAEREAPHRAAFRAMSKPATVRPESCGNPRRHSFCGVYRCTARPGECEACHDTVATRDLVLDGTVAGSSGPVTKGVKLFLCDPCYRDGLKAANDRGHGGVVIYWHAGRAIGQPIRYNDMSTTVRYAFFAHGGYDAAYAKARDVARVCEPGYAPTITDVMFEDPNQQRSYLVTRGGVDAVEFMTPGRAWGLAWDVRHGQKDGTFACAEIDPMTGKILEWIWVGPRVGDVLAPVTPGTWSHATVVSVTPDGRTCTLKYVSHLPEINELISTEIIPMRTFDLDQEVKSGRITIKRSN